MPLIKTEERESFNSRDIPLIPFQREQMGQIYFRNFECVSTWFALRILIGRVGKNISIALRYAG